MIHYFDRQRRTARREYMCDLCCGPIRPGQSYDVQASVDAGDWWQWREHVGCLDLYYELSGASPQDEIDPGALYYEYMGDDPELIARHAAIINGAGEPVLDEVPS